MGCGPSKSDLVVVQDVTGMTKKDATESFSRFKKEAGGSKIKLDKFTQLVSSLNTNKGKKYTHFYFKWNGDLLAILFDCSFIRLTLVCLLSE